METNQGAGGSSGEGVSPAAAAPSVPGRDGFADFGARYDAAAGGAAPGAGLPGVPAGRALPPVVGKILGRLFRLPCDLLVASTGDNHWDLDDDEIEILRESAVEVANAHNVVLDPKRQAWGVLAMAVLAIYGGRAAQWRAKMALEKKPDAKPAS